MNIEKKIEDYYKFYIGCDIVTDDGDNGYLTGIHGEYGGEIQLIENGNVLEWPTYHISFKLAIRPISDMTEKERSDIWDIIFQKRFINKYSGRTVFIEKSDNNKIPRWVMNSGVERLGIQFDGDIWADSDLRKWDFNTHEITRYLLSRSFDLFGLIDAGLAIDKTKIKNL